MPRQKATLSDLLADDVRDYFRREGVESDIQNDIPQNGRGRRKTAAGIMSSTARAPMNASVNMVVNGPQSPDPSLSPQNAPKSPPHNQMQHQMQRSHSSPNHSAHDHRRQSSGSSPKHLSLADAEFLRRYAEEKERANSKITPTKRAVNAAIPKDFVGPKQNGKKIAKSNTITAMMRPYNSLASSSRPPTVTGSHRPGLASIDNDDWEEDDRLERRDRRKAERHARKKSGASASSLGVPGHLRNGSVNSGHDRKKSSVSVGSGCHFRMRSGVSSENGSLVMLPPSPQQYNQLPYQTGENGSLVMRSPSPHQQHTQPSYQTGENGSLVMLPPSPQPQYNHLPYQPGMQQNNYQHPQVPPLPGYETSPGDTLCYSTSSQSNLHQSAPFSPWGAPRRHSRKDSASTFVRKYSTDTYHNMRSSTGSSVDTTNDNPNNKRGHVRPLSYLSASSGSASKEDSINGTPNFPNVAPSPPSSNGTMKTFPSDRFSRSESDGQSALFGSCILESYSSPEEKSVPFHRADGRGSNIREESSVESESGSSYTSSSSDGESSDSTGFRNGYGNGVYSEKDGFAMHKHSYSSIPQSKKRKRKVPIVPLRLDDALKVVWDKLWAGIVVMELYISNMPSLIGSLALAWGSLGVDWFKWYEETFDACHPTDYHNALCVFPEFPGCFTCDTTRIGYQFTLHFHYLCSTISVTMAFLLIGKIVIAFPVVRDELANPTTAAPLGLLCMALEKSFGGNFGVVGMGFTFVASALQTVVAIWFIFISIVYKTLPEPSWFPNTTGLGLAAAKIYLYWTPGGYFLSVLSILLFIMFYFVALYRIHTNIKISAPVCWVQISGPAVILYGFSIFGQPGSDEDELLLVSEENKQHFISMHQHFYMPIMHFFFACCMISMTSALYCVSIRFKRFREKEFSPAHVGFCAPVLSHANALQAYRSAVKRFSLLPHDHAFKTFLYQYWTFSLTSGTVLVVILTWRFVACLPTWCQIDVDDDEIPPEPEECLLTKLLEKGDAKDEMTQDYVSAAVLQANESGALVRVLRDGKMKYMRSRRMPSMGFDPIMTTSQLLNERERLLQHLTYAASLQDRRGTNSFDDTLSSFYERENSIGSSTSSLSSSRRSRRKNFMSFDASAMMRGEH